MSTNSTLLGHLGKRGIPFIDDLATGPAAAQATALPALTMASRFTYSTGATGSAILRDILTEDCPDMCWVINDTANSMDVYPNGTQTINGSTSPLTIQAAGFGFFSRVSANGDWRAQAFT